jgi:NAD(P)-dependent dehydrogenase (short-subunit alcohol dehydrogenase family)
MSLAFAQRGAAAVVVADIDGEGAVAVAAEILDAGGEARGIRTDVSDEAQVTALVKDAEEAYGPIDLFCANAGILVVGGIGAPDDAWQRVWSVNVMSHIYAARAVVPRMVERGAGYLLHTASAAGLLTQLGAVPYTVSKHAVVSFAEWLSITYGDAGVKVSCLCPQAVRTNLAGPGVIGADPPGAAASSGAGHSPGGSQAAHDGVLEPDDVAEVVVRGLAAEQFLILPHPEVATYERRRAEDRERWLKGMRRVQARVGGSSGPG